MTEIVWVAIVTFPQKNTVGNNKQEKCRRKMTVKVPVALKLIVKVQLTCN